MVNETDDHLQRRIDDLQPTDPPIQDKLKTSEQVLARITDGIYRRPWAALRELVSNAYDADATEVVILTDAPRFNVIKVRDNGNGFTPKALGHMLHHIGGSLKRTRSGAEANVADDNDPTLSPKGRKLIGKLGIGLFSVSQLTKHFQVITKRKGDRFRTIADVTLKTYNEDELAEISRTEEPEFETGDFQIHKQPASDRDSHGTEIILLDILKRTKAELRSAELWAQVRKSRAETDNGEPIEPPPFHIGHVDEKTGDTIEETAELPWKPGEKDPKLRFEALVRTMLERSTNVRKPTLANTFDNYFQAMWMLGLAAPFDYVYSHPFDLTAADGVRVFLLSNEPRGRAEEIQLTGKARVRDVLKLRSPDRGKNPGFSVVLDGVQLLRPLQFTEAPVTDNALQTPLLFIAKHSVDFTQLPVENRGGNTLDFEGYLLWLPKIVPIDHAGVLLRIHEAGGALFDKTFLNYQVAEHVRREQVTSEIFVVEGLEAALNIDRESFNYSHPHYFALMRWVHNAFRQLATRQKDIGRQLRSNRRAQTQADAIADIEKLLRVEFERAGVEVDRELVAVELVDGLEASPERKAARRKKGILVFDRQAIFGTHEENPVIERQISAIVQTLEAFHAFDDLSQKQQDALVRIVALILKESSSR